ncbi:MAG: hypothetical protein PVF17_12035 [Ignavibacteria bacterium]|jgi:hypothetical protein
MIKETTVTEQDIFNYVFYTDLLSKEEIESIVSNEKNYELIEFYKKQKEEFDISIKVDIKKKLASRIPVYKISKDK